MLCRQALTYGPILLEPQATSDAVAVSMKSGKRKLNLQGFWFVGDSDCTLSCGSCELIWPSGATVTTLSLDEPSGWMCRNILSCLGT